MKKSIWRKGRKWWKRFSNW